MIIWRLCQQRYVHLSLDGEGARLYGGRWNFPGTPIVYTAGSLALAALEVLVHVDHDIAPADLVAIPIEIPKRVRIEKIETVGLPPYWRRTPAPEQLQELGTTWARRGTSLLLRVPSALIPEEYNYLVNPAHSAITRLKVGEPRPFLFDPRLFSSSSRS